RPIRPTSGHPRPPAPRAPTPTPSCEPPHLAAPTRRRTPLDLGLRDHATGDQLRPSRPQPRRRPPATRRGHDVVDALVRETPIRRQGLDDRGPRTVHIRTVRSLMRRDRIAPARPRGIVRPQRRWHILCTGEHYRAPSLWFRPRRLGGVSFSVRPQP